MATKHAATHTEQKLDDLTDIVIPGLDLAGLAEYRDQQIGFAPYWTPNEEAEWKMEGHPDFNTMIKTGIVAGRIFLARCVNFDDKDSSFHRYVMQAGHQIKCFRGPKSRAEEVVVDKLGYFSISVYDSLPVGSFMGLPILVIATGKITIPGNVRIGRIPEKLGEHDVWQWRVLTDKKVSEIMDRRRMQAMNVAKRGTALNSAGGTDRALPPARTNGHGEVPAPAPVPQVVEQGDAYEEEIPF